MLVDASEHATKSRPAAGAAHCLDVDAGSAERRSRAVARRARYVPGGARHRQCRGREAAADHQAADAQPLRGAVGEARFGSTQLVLEEVEQSLGAAQTGVEGEPPIDQKATGERKPPQRNRGALPAHLPRVEIVIDVEDKRCPCCGAAMHVIDEDVSEMLDVVPALYRVKVIRRPRYGCRGCESAVVQAPAPERPLTGGMATEAVLAQVLVAKVQRRSAALSPGADLCPQRHRSRSFDPGELGRTRLLVVAPAGRAAARHDPLLAQDLCRRHTGAGARSRARPHQDRATVVLYP